MTRGQQIVLSVIVLLLLGVTALLAVTLLNTNEPASSVPTLAVLPTALAPSTRAQGDTPAPMAVPPTWTAGPTRTSPATSTPRHTRTATLPPTITPTFAPTFTPRPTKAITPSLPGPTETIGLQNPGFEGIRGDTIPGWEWSAADNYTPGGDYNPDTSFEIPLVKQADDPVRFIDGPTLQVDAVQHLKFRIHIFQTVVVSPAARVGFKVMAGAYSDTGVIQMAAGVDALGRSDCENARWSDTLPMDQEGGVQAIIAPQVIAGDTGQVTVCLYAEPLYAAVSNAAFFDGAELSVNSD